MCLFAPLANSGTQSFFFDVHPLLTLKLTGMKPVKHQPLDLNLTPLLQASFLFEAAVNPMRQQLLAVLTENEHLTARSLGYLLNVEEAICLQQLSILCGAGLLRRNADGNDVFFSVRLDKLNQLYACAEAVLTEPLPD